MKKVELELGTNLIPLMKTRKSGTNHLPTQIQKLRRKMLETQGFVLGVVHISTSELIDPDQYRILIEGREVAFGEVVPGRLMAIAPRHNRIELEGIVKPDPLMGKSVIWIEPRRSRKVESRGFSLFSDVQVITRHLKDMLDARLSSLMTVEDMEVHFARLPGRLHEKYLAPVRAVLSDEQILNVFQLLSEERVSLADSIQIFKSMSHTVQATRNLDIIAENIREALAKQIIAGLKDKTGCVSSITLSNEWEKVFNSALQEHEEKTSLVMQNDQLLEFLDELEKARLEAKSRGEDPVLLTRSSTRRMVRLATREYGSDIVVLSQSELPTELPLRNLGFV